MISPSVVTHWDEVPWTRMERGHIAGDWQSLTGDRSVTVGVKRVRAGPDGLRLLAYGTPAPDDIVYYPRSQKVSLRGVGIILRADQLDYWDGED